MLYQKGDTGRHVKEIQQLLKFHGFWTYPSITENYGDVTVAAVKQFQKAKGLGVDGKVGEGTLNLLLKGVDADLYTIDESTQKSRPNPNLGKDTDNKLANLGAYTTVEGATIHRHYMDTDEYISGEKLNSVNFFIHHSAGGHSAVAMGNMWNTDTRGRIGTQYGISGRSLKGDDSINGQIVEFFPDHAYGWHIGKCTNFSKVAKSVGVELCNYGAVTLKQGKFYNYVNSEVPADQVITLSKPFRGHLHWHNYTDAQIEQLRLLLLHVEKIYPTINIRAGLPALLKKGVDPTEAFGYQPDCDKGVVTGTWTHTNVRKDKLDCYPHPKLVAMLKAL